MYWESIRVELPVLSLCEVSSACSMMLAQPQRLVMSVKGLARTLEYYPDALARVTDDCARDIERGMPFEEALLAWRSAEPEGGERSVIIEAKSALDGRLNDDRYKAKLRLARQAYQRMGALFVEVHEGRDIGRRSWAGVNEVLADRWTRVDESHVAEAVHLLRRQQGDALLGELEDSLGGWGLGRARACALHVRRVISIDVRTALTNDTPVRLMPPGAMLLNGD